MEKGRAIRQALADANPHVTQFQRDLAISLSGIGHLRQVEGQAAEAAEAYRKALAILERLPQLPPWITSTLAVIHAQAGRARPECPARVSRPPRGGPRPIGP